MRYLWILLFVPLVAAHGAEEHATPAWQSDELHPGDTFERRFDVAGTYAYEDQGIGALGWVRVVAGGPAQAYVDLGPDGPASPQVKVGPGGAVTWTVSAGTHHLAAVGFTGQAANQESPAVGILVTGLGLIAVSLARGRGND